MEHEKPSRRFRGEISVAAGQQNLGPWLLPYHHAARIGRAPGSAIRLPWPWVPRTLATITSAERGWVLENGTRTRVRVMSRWVADAAFEPNALVFLQPGRWSLEWDLDEPCECRITITTAGAKAVNEPPYALNTSPPRDAPPERLTDLAAHRLNLSDAKRHLLAVLFAHLLEERPAPENLSAAAAERLGLRPVQVKRRAYQVRDRLNEMRGAQIKTLEELGYYLVVTTQELQPEDLEP